MKMPSKGTENETFTYLFAAQDKYNVYIEDVGNFLVFRQKKN